MVRPVLMFGGVAILGVIISKLLWMALLPLVGMFIGFVVFMLKVVLIVALLWAGYKLAQKLMERPAES